MPPGLAERILATAASDERRSSFWEGLAALLRPGMALPAAAAIVLAIGLGFLASHQPARASAIDAAYYIEDHSELAATVPFGDQAIAPAMLTADDGTADQRAADDAH